MADFALTFHGFNEVIQALSDIATEQGDTGHLQAVGDKIADEMQAGYVNAGFVKTGLLTDPRITHAWVKQEPNGKAAMYAGVIKWDAVMTQYKRNPDKDIPPNVLAYWIEYGVRPHLTHKGFRLKSKDAQTIMGLAAERGVKINPGIKPHPIISSTFYSNEDAIIEGVSKFIDSKIDKAFK
jgi:hypothetical protein